MLLHWTMIERYYVQCGNDDDGDDNLRPPEVPLPRGWSVFRSVKKIAPCHATCSPLSLVRLSNKDRERPRARIRTSVLVTGDNILSHHFHSIPLFTRFISPFCRSVSEDETSNKLRTNVVYVKDHERERKVSGCIGRRKKSIESSKFILQNVSTANAVKSKAIRKMKQESRCVEKIRENLMLKYMQMSCISSLQT